MARITVERTGAHAGLPVGEGHGEDTLHLPDPTPRCHAQHALEVRGLIAECVAYRLNGPLWTN